MPATFDEDKGQFARTSAVAALTVSVGTADGTIADVGSSFSQTTLNNNFRDLADKINELRTALIDAGVLATD